VEEAVSPSQPKKAKVLKTPLPRNRQNRNLIPVAAQKIIWQLSQKIWQQKSEKKVGKVGYPRL
jgi:hypothetical protein